MLRSGATAIEWCDRVWNPVTGCTKVSAGCTHCYAETFARRQMGAWKGRLFTNIRCHPERLEAPLRWRKPARVFVNSMSDLFHPNVPDTFVDRVFSVMALAPRHTFIVLTKRPDRMREYFTAPTKKWTELVVREAELHRPSRRVSEALTAFSVPLLNLVLGVSVEDKKSRDERVPKLLQTPAAIRAISAEPLLEDIADDEVFSAYFYSGLAEPPFDDLVNWVIVGGESGPKARPCDLAWIRAIVQQCKAAGVATFVKQVGARPFDYINGTGPYRGDLRVFRNSVPTMNAVTAAEGRMVNTVAVQEIRHPKGSDPSEWPQDLRVREYPGGSGC